MHVTPLTQDERGRYVHVFSQSWLNSYFTCPEQARLGLTKQYPPDESEAAAKGRAVHTAIEAVLVDCAQPDEAVSLAFTAFREAAASPDFRFVKVKTVNTCLTHIENLFASWYDSVYPGLEATMWVEHEFRNVIYEDDERVIAWSGTIDYAERGLVIDWKTTANKDKYGTKFGQDGWEQQRWAIQPTVYSAAYAHELGELPQFAYVALSVTGAQPQTLLVDRTLGHVQFLTDQCVTVAQFIEKVGTAVRWPLRDQHALCSARWCMNWDACKGKYV